MIGYYVHHHGSGHLHRAVLIASALETVVVGMGSTPKPAQWSGPWLELPRDDEGTELVDTEAKGRLHWVPEHHAGLKARMAEISSWIDHVDPDLMIVDVSVEVALLARLHGVPVITVVLPGDRRDPAHELVHSLARRMLAAWPAEARNMVRGIDEDSDQLVRIGALSRFDDRETISTPSHEGPRRVVLLTGTGGLDMSAGQIDAARRQTPEWEWAVLGPAGQWVDDPWDLLTSAHVVVTHAGQNAVAEVAAARRPAIVVPQQRPFDEQERTAAALAAGPWPVTVLDAFPAEGWAVLLDSVAALPGEDWATWNDRAGLARAVSLIESQLREPADELEP